MRLSDEVLDRPTFLMMVETYMKTYQEGIDQVSHISAFCYIQGLLAAKQLVGSKPGEKVELSTDIILNGIKAGQERWVTVCQYLKDTRDVTFHPLAFYLVLKETQHTQSSHPYDVHFAAAMEQYAQNIVQEFQKDLEMLTQTPDPESLVYNENMDHLIDDFFRSLMRLKTFYRDTARYATDEERALHNHIMGLYEVLNKEMEKENESHE